MRHPDVPPWSSIAMSGEARERWHCTDAARTLRSRPRVPEAMTVRGHARLRRTPSRSRRAAQRRRSHATLRRAQTIWSREIERLRFLCSEERENQYRRNNPDRKSTRLNSSHSSISYAVFCLKKKKKHQQPHAIHTKNSHSAPG